MLWEIPGPVLPLSLLSCCCLYPPPSPGDTHFFSSSAFTSTWVQPAPSPLGELNPPSSPSCALSLGHSRVLSPGMFHH